MFPVCRRSAAATATGFATRDVVVTDLVGTLAWMGGRLLAGVRLSDGDAPGPTALMSATPDGTLPIG
jgi:hypothetical protein